MALVLDLLEKAPSEPAALAHLDTEARTALLAAHVRLVAELLWRLAFVAAGHARPRLDLCFDEDEPVAVAMIAEHLLDTHEDPRVRGLAELATRAGEVSYSLRKLAPSRHDSSPPPTNDRSRR